MINFWYLFFFQFFFYKVYDKFFNIDDGVFLEVGEVGFLVFRFGELLERVQGFGYCAVNIGGD